MKEELKRLRVVIADDESLIVMNLREILQDQGFQVVGTASDGFEAIAVCRDERPDVVLLDVKMPLLDGLTAAQVIFEEGLADTVIMLTAFSDDDIVERASAMGVAGYLVKPVDENALVPCIRVGRARSAQLKALQHQVDQANEVLESRKQIERAKGILESRDGMTEQEAYAHIRNISRDKHISMKQVAEIIIRSGQ